MMENKIRSCQNHGVKIELEIKARLRVIKMSELQVGTKVW